MTTATTKITTATGSASRPPMKPKPSAVSESDESNFSNEVSR